MSERLSRQLAYYPQDLERLLVARQHLGDTEGMAALYEPRALVDGGGGRLCIGREAIRMFFADLCASGQRFHVGQQQPTTVCEDLALTSTRLPDGTVTAEVARRQADGTWLWVIDRFSIS